MQPKKKFIFVTGASGYIGKYFIESAARKNFKIFALSRKKRKNKKNIYWINSEIDNDFKKYLRKSKILVHFSSAGVYNKKIPASEFYKENVYKPYKLLLNSIKYGCKKWIIIGSASEYGKSAENNFLLDRGTIPLPESNYEKSKYFFSKLAIKLSKKKKVKCRILRIFNVYGKREKKNRLLSAIRLAVKNKKKFIVHSSNQKKDFIHINLVVRILIDTLNFKKNSKNFPQIWHIASGNAISVKDFIFSKIDKKKMKYLYFKNKNNIIRNFVSSKKSIWTI